MTGAAPQPIYCFDLVTIRRRDGANDERGLVINSSVHVGKRLRVLLADGTVVSASKRGHVVADRSYFRPGHVVVAASDRGGQIGVVTGVATALDLVRFSSGDRTQAVAVARGVSPSGLRRVTELSEGGYVVSGPWLGRVLEVSHDVDVLFDDDDGALCRVTGAEHKLEAAGINNWTRYTDCLFYPGQRVTGGSSVFKASRWIRGYWKPTRRTGTVARVDMAGVVVCWVASMELGTSKPLIQASAPPAYQSCPHRLEIFPSVAVEPSHWCVGDRCFFRCHEHPQGACCNSAAPCLSSGGNQSGSSLSLLPPSTTRKDTSSPSMKSHRKRTRMLGVKRTLRLDQRHAEFERPMSVADTRTTVDVLWQDGTTQCGVPSASLLLFTASNEHDFIPGEHVVGTGPSATANALGAFGVHGGAATDEPAARFGVVRSLSSKDQTVCVAWSKPTTSALGAVEAVVDGSCDETVSAYDLARNFDQDFFYGDVVVRLRPAEIAQGSKKKPAAPTTAHNLSWVGHIVDLCDDGNVQVKWGDGIISKVLPHEIDVVKYQTVSEMLHEFGHWVYDNGEVDKPQEDTSQELAIATDNGSVQGNNEDSVGESNVEEEGPEAMRTIRAVTRALVRLASEAFARGKRYLVDDTATAKEGGDSGGGGDRSNTSREAEEGATDDVGPFRFRRFDVAQCPMDHHFLDSMEQGTAVGRKWTKRVQKEWKALENDLPDAIYVRVFEDRMDLLRAVIVGASGTPYHDGLFFFDLHLPPSYPAEPPQVNYLSFGLHVNPNLYPSGTVCLSLLNTFGGQGTELWLPEASSVLQVVVSIQGLVLTAQPYYNEPAHGDQAGTAVGRRNELPYGENTYLLTLQTMLHLLRRPPAGFEELVADHFRRRGQHVLRACEAYLEGCLVGTLDGEARATEGSRERPCSAGFRLALRNVLPRLVEAFAGIGAQGCEQFHKFQAPTTFTLQPAV